MDESVRELVERDDCRTCAEIIFVLRTQSTLDSHQDALIVAAARHVGHRTTTLPLEDSYAYD